MSDTDNRERQQAELDLLASMYPSEYTIKSPVESSTDVSHDPAFTLQIHPSFALSITLPRAYPASAKPHVYLDCGGDVGTHARRAARRELARIVEEQDAGSEVLDLVVSACFEAVGGWTDAAAAAAAAAPDADVEQRHQQHQRQSHAGGDEEEEEATVGNGSSVVVKKGGGGKEDAAAAAARGKARKEAGGIKRVVIWSHHLLATSKRRDILTWSKELHLSGFSRPGYPGAVFAEGEVESVDEFVRRLKALRWQALQVRAEEVGGERLCRDDAGGEGGGQGVKEVEGLGDVVEGLGRWGEGVREMFLDGMKISASSSSVGKGG
ncbi:hypothetical protein LTS18_004317 [Coniosporium uncinatum]|uniref:Uncharacterized protein n=1 Tax=Coniosporium uncinatum TaxID=93489 RepID=A0ACC3DSA5_9PEZI|nr:hypothetical protein LTS18_004317 [Coniosporium uncinatum]